MIKKKTPRSSAKRASCRKHEGLPLLKYCLSCNERVCKTCEAEDHKAPDHDVATFETAIETKKKSMVKTVQQSIDKRNRLKECKLKSQEVIDRADEEEIAALESVENHRKNLKIAIDEICNNFVAEVKMAKKGKVDAVNDQLGMISQQEKRIAASELILKNTLKMSNDSIFEEGKRAEEKNLKKMLRQTEAETLPPVFSIPVSYFPNEEYIQLIKSSPIGLVITEKNCLDLKLEKTNQREPVVGEIVTILVNRHPALAHVPITDNFQPILVDGQGNTITLPLVRVDGRLEITFVPLVAAEHTIQLQLGNGRFSESVLHLDVMARKHVVLEIGNDEISNIKLDRPNDVCITSDGFYAIADRFNNRIVVCNQLGQLQNEIKAVRVGEDELKIYPHGVSSTPNGGILIADPENKIILLCDYAGHVSKRFGGDMLKFPTSVAVDYEGSIHVMDSKRNALFTFSEEGEFLRRVPDVDDDILSLANPRYVCTSPTGEIIVADTGNSRILVLDMSGKPLNFIKIEYKSRFGYPTGLAVDDQGTIYVSIFQEGGTGNAILKYKMTGKSLGSVDTGESIFSRGMCMDTSFPYGVVVFADHNSSNIKGIFV